MIVICNGMPRSGSTWSFNVVLGLLRRCYPGENIHFGYSQAIVEFVKAAPPTARHVIMKSHFLTPYARALARTGGAKVVFTWRDLPDAMASALRAFSACGDTFEGFFKAFDAALELLAFHRETGNAVIIGYDEILGRRIETIHRIGGHLGLERLTPQIINDVAEETSIERMQRIVERINATGNERLLRVGNRDFYDPETLLRKNHIHDGRPGYGRAALTAEQVKQLNTLCEKYGFPG